ncbi:MAG: FHA domain-containing protein [Eggerthellaceae bacterium]|nr:FHA domain-containing protein [Eggerthellaceae bacterium]
MANTCPICSNEIPENASVCPSCGYRVMGSTQSFTPVSIGNDSLKGINGDAQRFEMRVVRGPQTGIDIELRQGELSVGRDPKCDIFLNDMTVSREHAVIEVKADSCIIRDQNSFNGVWVNDRMVETCLLKSGDLLQIGAFCLLFRERP